MMKAFGIKPIKTTYTEKTKGIRTIYSEYLFFEIIDSLDVDFIEEIHTDDYESAFMSGIYHGFDGLDNIDVDKVIKELERFSEDDRAKEIIKKLEPAKGWTLHFNYVPKELQ